MSEQIRIDPHVKVLGESVVERAERRGLDALVYAPHFTRLPEIRRRAERYTTEDLLVVPGREVFTGSAGNRKHVLALGLSEPVPDFVGLDAAMAEFERQDATVLVPHPEFVTVGLDAADLWEYCDVIDAIEVYNPKHWPQHNRRARELVDELDLPAFGSSYAHLPWTVGDVWTEFDAEPAQHGPAAGDGGRVVDSASHAPDDDETRDGAGGFEQLEDSADVEAALASGRGRVRRRIGVGPASRSMAEFLHLFWENSLAKTHKFLQGPKDTNPYHPEYEDRFRKVAVFDEPRFRSFRDE